MKGVKKGSEKLKEIISCITKDSFHCKISRIFQSIKNLFCLIYSIYIFAFTSTQKTLDTSKRSMKFYFFGIVKYREVDSQ